MQSIFIGYNEKISRSAAIGWIDSCMVFAPHRLQFIKAILFTFSRFGPHSQKSWKRFPLTGR